MIKLNYAKGGDMFLPIEEIELEDKNDLMSFLLELRLNGDKNTVYLFTSNLHGEELEDFSREILIECDLSVMLNYCKCLGYDDNEEVHIHEYSSFEDAYKVALDMREGNPLCYN